MHNFSVTPKEMVCSLFRNWELVKTLVGREINGRYRSSVLGIFWSFINPVLMLIVYTFVFSVIFKARWHVDSVSKTEFALILFAGLMIYNIFSECINRAPNIIISNVNYVKKVVFPLEVLPWVVLGSALFHALISFTVWLVAYSILFGIPQPTILFLPLIILPLVLFIMGLSWFLASLGVFLRDISQFIGILTTMLLFLTPIFYPISALPEVYRKFLLFNPLTPAVEQARKVIYWGETPDFFMLGVYVSVAGFFAWIGFYWFQRTRAGFADVV